ncbi:AIP [Acanthosepion pharaonis]|uniref:AIP n=1 Tax=Acanthosepion pharaonis TaxID=158019 RepID=A0A812BE47_ACAPH|nr:AIP [Sepia pharaonis]
MAEIFKDLREQGIQKKIIYPGQGEIPSYGDGVGWKLTFQYHTRKCDETVIDDSKKPGNQSMELLLGKKFTLRNIARSKDHGHSHTAPQKSHCCGMMSMTKQGLGYPDLDALLTNPEPLIFTLELIKIESPGDYKREAWELNETEKLEAIQVLREEGNNLYREQNFDEATDRYSEALGMLEQLMLIEKPGDEGWQKLNKMQIPLLLNFCQCKLLSNEYYTVIEHCNTVLKHDPDNVKALFRRGKAHIGAWNPEDARNDLERVIELDSSATKDARKQLKILEELKKQKDLEDRERLRGKLFG